MITEKLFASSHHAFWHDLLPMGEHYIRSVNHDLERFDKPMRARSSPAVRGIVNELSFRLFVRATTEGIAVEELQPPAIADAVSSATAFIKSFRQHGRGPMQLPDERAIQEAIDLARRTGDFFRQATGAQLLLQPSFQGCGWLSACEGDVLASDALYEVKAGARLFRMLDVRQVLLYCALNFSSKAYEIREVGLVNPREGTYFTETLSRLCDLLAGRSSIEILSEIVEYVSESIGTPRVD